MKIFVASEENSNMIGWLYNAGCWFAPEYGRKVGGTLTKGCNLHTRTIINCLLENHPVCDPSSYLISFPSSHHNSVFVSKSAMINKWRQDFATGFSFLHVFERVSYMFTQCTSTKKNDIGEKFGADVIEKIRDTRDSVKPQLRLSGENQRNSE